MMAQPVEIFPEAPGSRVFVHHPTGERFGYNIRGGTPKCLMYYGPGDARTKSGKPIPIYEGEGEGEGEQPTSGPLPVPMAGTMPDEDTFRKKVEIREDLKAIVAKEIAEGDSTAIAPFLKLYKTVVEDFSREWFDYERNQRMKMAVPVEDFLNPIDK